MCPFCGLKCLTLLPVAPIAGLVFATSILFVPWSPGFGDSTLPMRLLLLDTSATIRSVYQAKVAAL